jgi:hypothetical protein
MIKQPRAHHFVPEFLLAGFTPSGKKDDFLHVIDNEGAKRWRAKPKEVAHERDFYRVEASDGAPGTLEKNLSNVEGKAAAVIRSVLETAEMPVGQAKETLMLFIALAAARVPRTRDYFVGPLKKVVEIMLANNLTSLDSWQKFMGTTADAGSAKAYKTIKRLFHNGKISVDATQHFNIDQLFNTIDTIYPWLMKRNWMIVVPQSESAEFVCSDDPVALSWDTQSPPSIPIGFGLRRTEVNISLHRKMALCGRFDPYPHASAEISDYAVGMINSRIASGAKRVYSASKDFPWLDKSNKLRIGGLLEVLAEARKRKAPAVL